MVAVIQEYVFYFANVFAGLSSLAFAYVLFLDFLKNPKRKGFFWRVIGFTILALTFLLFEWARINPSLINYAIICETSGLFFIFIGLYFSRELVVAKNIKNTPDFDFDKIKPELWKISFLLALMFIVLFLLMSQIENGSLLVYIIGALFNVAIIFLQIKRYFSSKENRRLNLLAIFALVFILLRIIVQIILNFPKDTTIAYIRSQTVDFSPLFYAMLVFTFLGFLFLLILNWKYLVAGFSQRLFVILMVFTIVIANVSALFVSVFVVDQIRTNNVDLVKKGVRVQNLLFIERGKKAQYYANTFSKDSNFISLINSRNTSKLSELVQNKITETGLDEIKIYNKYSEVLINPIDPRDNGTIKSDDKFLGYSILEKKGLLTVDSIEGVLANDILMRSIYPVIVDSNVIGAIETNYKFDNAFADYIKSQTDLDVTIYSDSIRSASTIRTDDNVSRWIGTIETDNTVIESVMKKGLQYENESLVFGSYYFTSYLPLRDINGNIIGMISSQISIDQLMESTRYQSIINFIVITNISLIGALVVFIAIRKVFAQKLNEKILNKKSE